MRAAELDHRAALQPAGLPDRLDGLAGLLAQCLRLDAAGFVRDGVVVRQLRESAPGAQNHRQFVG
ncbi:hypothetical protein NJ76_10635 [Rhodococcus sp. IITR03]|nr:hypothetical protein NJ76_10635 [Rhodococcus sp. IITR03]